MSRIIAICFISRLSGAVKAFLMFYPGITPDLEAVREYCQANTGRFEVPKHMEIVDALPVTPAGKVQKHKLRKHFSDLFAE